MSRLAGDHVRVLVGGYELTGDSHRIGVSDARDMYDAAAFGDEAHHFVPGRRLIRLDHAGYLNAAAARSHPVLKAGTVSGILSVLLGQNTDPVVGDPVYSVGVVQGQYQSQMQAGAYVPFAAQFAASGDRGGWGAALAIPVSFTDSSSGAAVDGGSASSGGGAAFLHIFQAAASDTYTFTVEGSATDAFSGEESTLATFTLDASQVGSERVALSGSIPRYTRWKGVRSGSTGETVQIAVSLVRF